ncbi:MULTISPECIES: VacJ family lipoprotein [unclassified Thioalkalivibrio]|uniref:MlaA family lipoprotein n=1 Tax=unclassified Thioalkalivibrio TaxID=2621013 RepID=UPI0003A2A6AB|nr:MULTISPECIES: VacJ family lipoprotein [unclassified Thioalkalivibrio]
MSVVSCLRPSLLALTFLGLAGCATVPSEDRHPDDPWESYNRAVFEINQDFDESLLRPAAVQYQRLPQPVQTGVGNFFSNLNDFTVLFNNLLQGNLENAASDTGRIMFNSTFGLFGLIDVASPMGLDKNNEDFGQTLGAWGVPRGPYFQIPLLGPSTARDAPARLVDWYSNPISYHTNLRDDHTGWWVGLIALEVVDMRAGLISTERMLDQLSDDPYIAMRQGYLQRRDFLVRGGMPDDEADAMLDELDELEALEAMEAEEGDR